MVCADDRHIRLRDGRKLGYAEYGASDGRPVFLFHGTPGSRLLPHPDATIAVDLQVRLIAPDRPGIGLSDDQPGRELLDWPADVRALADALAIDRFAVAGFSGGGPYALACSYALPERVTAAAVISGVGPIDLPGVLDGMLPSNRMGYTVGRRMPWPLWRWIFGLYYGGVRRHPETLARMSDDEPEVDRAIFAEPGVRQMLTETFAEAFRQGTAGVARDGWLLSRPWGFPLEQVDVPVSLWQGEADVVVTPAMGRTMADRLPRCHATFLPGDGHLLFIKHWRAILRAL